MLTEPAPLARPRLEHELAPGRRPKGKGSNPLPAGIRRRTTPAPVGRALLERVPQSSTPLTLLLDGLKAGAALNAGRLVILSCNIVCGVGGTDDMGGSRDPTTRLEPALPLPRWLSGAAPAASYDPDSRIGDGHTPASCHQATALLAGVSARFWPLRGRRAKTQP